MSSPTVVADLAARLRTAGAVAVPDDDPELNPCWPDCGAVTFVDPDGYRLVILPDVTAKATVATPLS